MYLKIRQDVRKGQIFENTFTHIITIPLCTSLKYFKRCYLLYYMSKHQNIMMIVCNFALCTNDYANYYSQISLQL